MEELKNCPFCGGKAIFVATENIGMSMSYNYGIEFEVLCDSCGAANRRSTYKIIHNLSREGKMEVVRDDRKRAIEEWNNRV